MIAIGYGVSLLLAGAALLDQLRRRESAWVAARRDRGWWTGITAASGAFGLGVLAAAAYAVLVLPRLGRSPGWEPAFRKGAARPAPTASALPGGRDRNGRLVVEFDD